MKKLALVSALSLGFGISFAAHAERLKVKLSGYQEVPSVSTFADAKFEAQIRDTRSGPRIEWELTYDNDFSSPVTQAHIHFGERHTIGGISVFLCTNLGNGPAGTQPCPPGPVTIRGEADAGDVIGPTGQLIAAGEIEELVAAIRAGAAYVNIHTTAVPSGETRAQLPGRSHRDHD